MLGLTFIVVGPPGFLSLSTRRAWEQAGIGLLGPYPLAGVDLDGGATVNGAIVDILEEPEDLFLLSQKLEDRHIPFIFALGADFHTASRSPFFLNDNAADIRKVVETLTLEGDSGLRH